MNWCTCFRDVESYYTHTADCRVHGETRVRARVLAQQARRDRIDAVIGSFRVLRCMQWSLDGPYIVRYGFAYRDPASGRFRQYNTTSYWQGKPTPEELARADEINKRLILREIELQCGVHAIKEVPVMYMPTAVADAVMV